MIVSSGSRIHVSSFDLIALLAAACHVLVIGS
jgi:hypothetical protein